MEKVSSISTSYYSDLSSIDTIVSVLFNIFLWVACLHEISFRFLCFTQVCISGDSLETISSTSTNSKSSEHDELLSREDLEMVMQKIGISEEMKRENTKENIAFDEVSDIFEENEPNMEEAKAAFSVFDKNSDGFIDASELQRVLSDLGFRAEVGLDECQGMIEVYDENKDGRIDFNEFLKFLESSLR
jgi:calmodulin